MLGLKEKRQELNEIFYFIGNFDGEGSFGVNRSLHNGKYQYYGQMVVGMKSERTVKKLQEITQLGKVYEYDDNVWKWVLCGKAALPFLEKYRHLFITKKEEAELYYQFLQLDKSDFTEKERLFHYLRFEKRNWK